MSTTSAAIYEGFKKKSDLERLVTEKITENLYLEFKQKRNRSKPDLEDTEKENFSDALSQFANSDGGVLIFGIKTEKPNDYASELKAIKKPDEFLMRLMDFLNYAVQPNVEGVEGKVITDDSDSGYVVFHIPASLKTPHRATISREYLKRGQFGKQKLEHFDLEDMFGRRQKPLLSMVVGPVAPDKYNMHSLQEDKSVPGHLGAIEYHFFVHNEGRYIGKNSMMILTCPEEKYAKCELRAIPGSSATITEISNLRGGRRVFQVATQNLIFYPRVTARVVILKLRVNIEQFDSQNDVAFEWEIYAEDMPQRKGSVRIAFKERIEWNAR